MNEARPQVRIRSAAELFAGLRHPEATIRLPTLAAVAAQPELVLAYGRHEGRDIIDELRHQLGGGGLFAPAILGALVVFGDDRVVDACCQVLEHDCGHQLLSLACRRLSREETSSAREHLRRLLFSHDPARASLAAECLRERPDLTIQEKIQICLWSNDEPPALSEPTARDCWLQLLDGPLRTRARHCLEEQGQPAFDWLAEVLELDSWLLSWGCGHFPERTAPLLERALQSELAGFALELLATHRQHFSSLCERASAFLSHPDPDRRRTAWSVAPLPQDLDWALAYKTEADPQAQLALVNRMALECPREEPFQLLAESADWRVRSAAAQGLTRLRALQLCRQLARHARVETKAVGASVLVALNDYEWLEEHLLS